MYSFLRTAAAAPMLKVADCNYNTEEIIRLIFKAYDNKTDVIVFPELCITAYTCGDLFLQTPLLDSAEACLARIAEETSGLDILSAIGLPVRADNQCFNCCALVYMGKILGLVPKTFIPGYSEFYEERWFASAADLKQTELRLCGQTTPIGSDLLFESSKYNQLSIGVEICEDLWAPIPPSSYLAMAGATLILNPSASNEIATKHEYRKNLASQQSSRCIAAYAYASAGIGESTQDVVFSGDCMIYENGAKLASSKRFSPNSELIAADIDLELLANDRRKNTSFMSGSHLVPKYRKIEFSMEEKNKNNFLRIVKPKPFIPENNALLNSRCAEIFNIQTTGISKRIMHTGSKSLVIGISGGLDSTLALLAAVKACDFLSLPHSCVKGITMPGFGTTDRTYNNAINLMKSLGVEITEIPISEAVSQHFEMIGHDPSVHDVTYENSQARERTQILMDIANKYNGIVVGTGDLSELALGWATYNGDHMSMYGVNSGIPKTLVRVLVKWVAEHGGLASGASDILIDVLNTPVSPELLPPDKDGNIGQKTEELVGPYELHDFFLYYAVRFGFSPSKIYFLAEQAFKESYSGEVILKWLKNFYRRFFSQQFKRSCLPDGPKVGSICLSPRGDWRMPSDASAAVWLAEADNIVCKD